LLRIDFFVLASVVFVITTLVLAHFLFVLFILSISFVSVLILFDSDSIASAASSAVFISQTLSGFLVFMFMDTQCPQIPPLV